MKNVKEAATPNTTVIRNRGLWSKLQKLCRDHCCRTAIVSIGHTFNSANHRLSHRSRDLYRREGSCRSRRSDAGGQVRFLPGKAEHFRERLQRCAHLWPATKTRCRLELLDLVTDHRRESPRHG